LALATPSPTTATNATARTTTGDEADGEVDGVAVRAEVGSKESKKHERFKQHIYSKLPTFAA